MFKFLEYQYEMQKITAEKLHTFVPRYITEEQYLEITAKKGEKE